jgi:hypothetical protein
MENNDLRLTIPVKESFHKVVKELFETKQTIAALYDDNGMTRANGMIKDLFEKEGLHWLRMEDGTEIRINSLHAVNGVFSSDYSTC